MLTDLTVELSQACPNRCLFCSSLARPESVHLVDRATVRSIARQAVVLGLRHISLSGGEPLEHPELEGVVADLREFGLAVHLYTTGIVRRDGVATAFRGWQGIAGAVHALVFNVQSVDPIVHDELVGRAGALALTMASMQAALEAGCKVEVHIVPNRINIASMERTVRALWAKGVRQVSLLRLVRQGYARDNARRLDPTPSDLASLREAAVRLQTNAPEGGLRLGIPFSGMVGPRAQCNAGLTKLIIRYDGRVFPCEAFKDRPDGEFALGDVRRDSLMSMLGNGPALVPLSRLRARLSGGETCPAQVGCEG